MTPGQTLTTARLTLRPLDPNDAIAIAEALNDWDMARWLTRAPYPYGLGDADAFIAANSDRARMVWVILDAEGLCGCIGRMREFAFWVARRAWGRGYATEAGRAVLAHHFADTTADDLLSGYMDGNDRSLAVLTKLGFTPTTDRTVEAAALQRQVTIKGMRMSRQD